MMKHKVAVACCVLILVGLALQAACLDLSSEERTAAGPDLTIRIIRHCWYCKPGGGGWFSWGNYFHCIEAIVTNEGDVHSKPTHAMVYLKIDLTPLDQPGYTGVHTYRWMFHVPALAPGDEWGARAKLWHPGDRYCSPPILPWNRIIAEVDYHDRVGETDEGNNTYSCKIGGIECAADECPWE
jgi:hypothetical protein